LPHPEVPKLLCDARATPLQTQGMTSYPHESICFLTALLLFFTVHDVFGRAGEEDQFPASDNASKLKRSCENAEHVGKSSHFLSHSNLNAHIYLGLFAPSAGQHLRDEQRRRRSQYDRGTSLAEREEYGYDEGSMHSPYRYYPSCQLTSCPSSHHELTHMQIKGCYPLAI
jgi:hypothetical protein